jgi:CheY-like chemotaxis protein
MSFATPNQLQPVPADVKGSVVLIVDDERTWRIILETELGILGYRPLLASDAMQGLNQAVEHDPDVAIIDLALPGLDGWRLLAELTMRSISIPTVFYSAYPIGRAPTQHPDVVACVSKLAGTAALYAVLPVAIRTKERHKRRPGSAPPASPPAP